jgi:hypothetical protein
MKRDTHGAYQSVQNELKNEERQDYKNFVRVSPYDFGNLLKIVAPFVKMQATNCRSAGSPTEHLAVTTDFSNRRLA